METNKQIPMEKYFMKIRNQWTGKLTEITKEEVIKSPSKIKNIIQGDYKLI